MTETRWLDSDEERAWRAVRRLLTVVPSRLARDLNQLGLSTADYEVLSTLSEKPGRRWVAVWSVANQRTALRSS